MSTDDDLAAEVDDIPAPDGAPGAGVPTPDDAAGFYTGRCHGGPWDGIDAESRYPRGFLLVNMETRCLWIYDREVDGDFYVREDQPVGLLDEGPDNRFRAAEQAEFDIRVLDPEVVVPANTAGP